MQSAAYAAPIDPTNRSDVRDFLNVRAFRGAVSLQCGRFLHGRPPIRDAEKRSQRPDDDPLVSGDAPNRSWTDWFRKAAAAFLCVGVASLIVGQPLQKATAL
jgi:hypothetical protein